MGVWGTKLTDNDGTADFLIGWGEYFKKHKNSDGYVDFKKAKITKTDFGKAFPKMMKESKISAKELKKPRLLCSPYVSKIDYKSKYRGCWNINLILVIYVLGKNAGYVFNKDFLSLAEVSAYQYAATSGLYFDQKNRKPVVSIGNALAKSTLKKGKLNLMRYF